MVEFNDLNPGKQYLMKDENELANKTLIELINSNNELGGYMVVDHEQEYEVIEFAVGEVHPLQEVSTEEIYYLGPVSYAEKVSENELKDLKTDVLFDVAELNNIKTWKEANRIQSELEEDISPSNVTDYEYKLISAVPDYQQSNNTSMENDCVPTSAANVMMYWDSKGFPNISPKDNWKTVANRIGKIMGHTDSSGVSRSEIVPGLKKFLSERGYSSSFTISRDTSPTFNEMRSLIKNGDPSMMGTDGWMDQKGGHNITLVGYEQYYNPGKVKWYKSVIVRDNWKSTPKDVWFQFNSEDVSNIYKIVK